MNIQNYTSYFHDGTVHDINHVKNHMEIAMESAQLLPAWNEDAIKLSKYDTISGRLHLDKIKSIRVNENNYTGELRKTYDSSDINHFEILSNKAILLIRWINYPPNPYEETDIFTIEIEADEIYWENVPNLFPRD